MEPVVTGCAGDGNVCTDDVCDGSGACTHPANDAACDSVCTPGGTCSAGACISPAPAPDGTLCELDGNPCTRETCCGPCRLCNGPYGCVPSVRPSCVNPGRGTRIELRNGATDANDALAWRWADPDPGEGAARFGEPTTSTDYELCAFTAPDAGAEPLLALSVAAGGICGGRPCWHATSRGFRYRNAAAGEAAGLSAILLSAAPGKGSRISARGRAQPSACQRASSSAVSSFSWRRATA
jgi:hypothetical protein